MSTELNTQLKINYLEAKVTALENMINIQNKRIEKIWEKLKK